MKEEVKKLLEKYVTVKEIKTMNNSCIAYIDEIMLSSSFFNALQDYHYSIYYSEYNHCMGITMIKK